MLRSNALFLLLSAGIGPCVALAQHGQLASVPSNPLELATGEIQTVNTPEARAAAIGLLNRARWNYSLREGGHGYELKVSFVANSRGQIQYDGAWNIEEMFVPDLGLRSTAATAGFTSTRIRSQNLFYGDSDAPFVLHQARGALFGPMPRYPTTVRDQIRTTSVSFKGEQLTCVLLAAPGNSGTEASGRSWLENEECIDTQSGLLRVHSLVPGRYSFYDYTGSVPFHGHLIPRTVTITEAGNPVLEISVTSIADLDQADPNLFIPTDQMKTRGQATEEAGARKIPIFSDTPASYGDSTIHPVVLFGLLKPSGQIENLHSLQPADSNSHAALEEAKAMQLTATTAPGGVPEQRFVFIIKGYVSSQ